MLFSYVVILFISIHMHIVVSKLLVQDNWL